jgi:hypothetical protein
LAECLLGCVRHFLVASSEIREVAERVPNPCKSAVVLGFLEQRQCRSRELLELGDRRVIGKKHAPVGGDNEGECFADVVARCTRPLGRLLRDRRLLARRLLRVREVELEVDVELERPGQPERPLKQWRGGAKVTTPQRPVAGGAKTLAGSHRERSVGLSELGLVAGSLLQVEADNFVSHAWSTSARSSNDSRGVKPRGPRRRETRGRVTPRRLAGPCGGRRGTPPPPADQIAARRGGGSPEAALARRTGGRCAARC